jgi:hypothetical protein
VDFLEAYIVMQIVGFTIKDSPATTKPISLFYSGLGYVKYPRIAHAFVATIRALRVFLAGPHLRGGGIKDTLCSVS